MSNYKNINKLFCFFKSEYWLMQLQCLDFTEVNYIAIAINTIVLIIGIRISFSNLDFSFLIFGFCPRVFICRAERSRSTETARCCCGGWVLQLGHCARCGEKEKECADGVIFSRQLSALRDKTRDGIPPRQRHWHCAAAPLASPCLSPSD